MSSLLVNKKHAKIFALGCAANRAHKFTRVSGDFYATLDAKLKVWIAEHVRQLPSRGKTITGGTIL